MLSPQLMPSLAKTLLTRPDAPAPERWVLFLHGILGRGSNWRTFARQWVDAKEGWGAVLVDLRMHGESRGFEPPHTVQAAARDLVELTSELSGSVEAVVGHSFGGKVALAYVDRRHGDLDRMFLLDSTPGTRLDHRGAETTLGVLQFLERVGPTGSRNEFIRKAQEAGIAQGTAMWLAMNLEKRGETMQVALELDAIHALLDDYFRLDLWEVLDRPPGRVRFDVVLGGKSRVFNEAERAHLNELAAQMPDRIRLHTLPDAGHWVHVDDPAGISRILLS